MTETEIEQQPWSEMKAAERERMNGEAAEWDDPLEQAAFRLVEVAAPKVERPYLHLGDRVRVVAARISRDDMLVDVTVDKYTYRGVVRGTVTNVNIGGYATVQIVERVDNLLSNVRLQAHGATSRDRVLVVESVRNVTGA